MKPLIGYHTSSAGGYYNAVQHAREKYDLDTFQFFLGSPRTWAERDLQEGEIEKYKSFMKKFQFDVATVHLNYLANPSTPNKDKELRSKVRRVFEQELQRSELLDVDYLVFHLGSHKGKGFELAKQMIAELLEDLEPIQDKVNLLMETSAGSKNSVGATFDELAQLLNVIDNQKVGVCFDTCHVFAAGYDLSSETSVRSTMKQFDDIVGFDRLMVTHANDSKAGLGEGKDRHENIGKGYIGTDGFEAMLNHEAFLDKPFILETPSKFVKEDIKLLRKLVSDD